MGRKSPPEDDCLQLGLKVGYVLTEEILPRREDYVALVTVLHDRSG